MSGSSSGVWKVLAILGIIGGVVVAGCLGIVGFMFFWGGKMVREQAMAALNDNPVIQQHVGTITDLEDDWTTGAEEDTWDPNILAFKFTGTKATGVVVGKFISVDENTEKLVSGRVELSSGEVYDLFPDKKARADDAS